MISKCFLSFSRLPFYFVADFLCCAEWNVFFIYLSIPLDYRVTLLRAETMSPSEGPLWWVFLKFAYLNALANVVLLYTAKKYECY